MAPGLQLQPRRRASAESTDHGEWQGPRRVPFRVDLSGQKGPCRKRPCREGLASLNRRPRGVHVWTPAWTSACVLGPWSGGAPALMGGLGVGATAPLSRGARRRWGSALLSPGSFSLSVRCRPYPFSGAPVPGPRPAGGAVRGSAHRPLSDQPPGCVGLCLNLILSWMGQ